MNQSNQYKPLTRPEVYLKNCVLRKPETQELIVEAEGIRDSASIVVAAPCTIHQNAFHRNMQGFSSVQMQCYRMSLNLPAAA